MQDNTQNSFKKMNTLGAEGQAFFAFIGYNLEDIAVYTLPDLEKESISITFPAFNNCNITKHTSIALKTTPMAYANYKSGFEIILKNLQFGNSFLCNYTCSTPIETKATLQEIFTTAKAKYKILFKNNWVCFSPETFVQIQNNIISTYPMKGTIDASLPDARNILLNDKKETAEHYTIVDLLRNDLSMVAKDVHVKNFRYIEELKTDSKNLLQASSDIQGTMLDGWQKNIGDLLQKILPAGSISGAPKAKTLEIIQQAEAHDRGFYTGIAVYFDGKNLDSCVLIRFIENTKKGLVYKSGGGITHNSNAMQEYNEMLDKIYIPKL